MKKFHIAGKLLQCFVLAGLLTGCQNEDLIPSADTTANVSSDQNAKIAGEIRLVKDGERRYNITSLADLQASFRK